MKKTLICVLALAYLLILGSCGKESTTQQTSSCQPVKSFYFKNGKWWKKVIILVYPTPVSNSAPITQEVEIEVEVNQRGC